LAEGSYQQSSRSSNSEDLGEASSLLETKEWNWFHSSWNSSKRAKCQLVDKDECQTSLYWISCAAKECWTRKWEQAAKERTSWAKATSDRVQVIYRSQARRSKSQRREVGPKQWRFQERNEAASWRYQQDDETNDRDVLETSPTLVAHPSLFSFISVVFLLLKLLLLNLMLLINIIASDYLLLNFMCLHNFFKVYLTLFFLIFSFCLYFLYFLLRTKGGV